MNIDDNKNYFNLNIFHVFDFYIDDLMTIMSLEINKVIFLYSAIIDTCFITSVTTMVVMMSIKTAIIIGFVRGSGKKERNKRKRDI